MTIMTFTTPTLISAPPTIETRLQAQPKLHIAVHIDTDILDSEVARRKANVWLLMYAGNLLRADYPELIIDQDLMWRYDVLLTSPGHGTVGKLGQIRVHAVTGEVLAHESFGDELIANAEAIIKD